jgi:ATP-dependent Clp protease ATP-binding subunit ClpC
MEPRDQFTTGVYQLVILGNQYAYGFEEAAIRPMHWLMGLLSLPESNAMRVLRSLTDVQPLWRAVYNAQFTRNEKTSTRLPQTPEAKKVMQAAVTQAEFLGSGRVGTEHVLLAILANGDIDAAKILQESGLTYDSVKEKLHAMALPLEPTMAEYRAKTNDE